MGKVLANVEKYMSKALHTVGADQSLSTAIDLMEEYSIHHLPVLDEGHLAGILSERDVKFALNLGGVSAYQTQVGEVAREDIYLTSPRTPLNVVVHTMAQRKVGSVLVVDNHRLVGIFTAIDALRAFDELLETRTQES